MGHPDQSTPNSSHGFSPVFSSMARASQKIIVSNSAARLVSHDHDLVDEVATRIWHFEADHKIQDFKGVYEEYRAVPA
jgi:hypothetical protein